MNLDAMKAGRAGFLLILPLFVLLLAAGCTGSANNNAAPYSPETGHPADFVTTHPTFAMADSSTCTPCHGADLSGGTSRVSCSATSWNGIACHAGGPGHGSQDWVDNVHFLRAKTSLASCNQCHGADLRGGTSGLSCFAASFNGFGACHTNGPDHLAADYVSVTHRTNALPDGSACFQCHGADLLGGLSGVSCFSASRNGITCHATGPVFHPASWLDCTARGTNNWHGTAYANNSPVCFTCHGDPTTSPKCISTCHYGLGGRVPPGLSLTWSHGLSGHHDNGITFDNAIQAVCINCHATHNRFGQQPLCHNCHPPFPGSSHPANWKQAHAPAARTAGVSALAGTCGGSSGGTSCHGATLLGAAGPSCVSCHTGEAMTVAANLSNCRTCHGNPPPGNPPLTQPNGLFPNIAGAHGKHLLSGVTCATCHTGAGMPLAPAVQTSLLHSDGIVQLTFAAGYNAQTGTLGYTGAATRTCVATICHGGQTTPDWRRTPAALACTACHKSSATAPPQFNDYRNSPFSRHTFHIGRTACTTCHDAAWLAVAANHYPDPKATTFPPGAAIASLRAQLSYVAPGSNESSCNTTGLGSCH
jgi:predicted CxxxxCH...CXXCH cytochrome family protein